MTNDYVELFLKWSSSGDNPHVKQWLEERGLSTLRMLHGLLVSGSRQDIEKAFSVTLDMSRTPIDLPVPEDLKPHVASITLPTPRSSHR
jgi:hypothetical protein